MWWWGGGVLSSPVRTSPSDPHTPPMLHASHAPRRGRLCGCVWVCVMCAWLSCSPCREVTSIPSPLPFLNSPPVVLAHLPLFSLLLIFAFPSALRVSCPSLLDTRRFLSAAAGEARAPPLHTHTRTLRLPVWMWRHHMRTRHRRDETVSISTTRVWARRRGAA